VIEYSGLNIVTEFLLKPVNTKASRAPKKRRYPSLIQRRQGGSPMQHMYYVVLNVQKRTAGYCVRDGSGAIHRP